MCREHDILTVSRPVEKGVGRNREYVIPASDCPPGHPRESERDSIDLSFCLSEPRMSRRTAEKTCGDRSVDFRMATTIRLDAIRADSRDALAKTGCPRIARMHVNQILLSDAPPLPSRSSEFRIVNWRMPPKPMTKPCQGFRRSRCRIGWRC